MFGAEIALGTDAAARGPHLTLLVKDREGWRSLCRLLTAAQLAGSKGHAPVPPAALAARVAECPEALTNTRQVADRCAFVLNFGRHIFPAAPIPADRGGSRASETPDGQLRALCHEGLIARYGDEEPTARHRATRQLDHELGIIRDLGLASFFLVVRDVVRFARAASRARGGGQPSAPSWPIRSASPASNRSATTCSSSASSAASGGASPILISTSATPAARK
jgi:DNA polymerase III alpha subunit